MGSVDCGDQMTASYKKKVKRCYKNISCTCRIVFAFPTNLF